MWYVVQVKTGSEEAIVEQCRRTVSRQDLERCFIPYYQELRRYKGKWNQVRRNLFPGYVFMVTEDVDALYEELKHVIGLTRLLGTDGTVLPLSPREVEFLLQLGGEKQVVELSQGVIENNQLLVLKGPLKGKERLIKKIDRHKRKAWLQVPVAGTSLETQVSLEIVSKN